MSFNWSEYLTLAQQLAGKAHISASQESRLRSAISRAYYAAFIQARNYLQEQDGMTIPLLESHKFVINQFKNSSDPVRQLIGNNLKRLRDNRNKADYHNTFALLPLVTRQTLRLAAKVIADLQSLSTING
jgi:uncharacterized protein (UPF0332 family)